ncbi:hypothetical protein ACQ9ZH_21115 [Pseudomonas chlororaphis]
MENEFEKLLTGKNKAFIEQFPHTPILLSKKLADIQQRKTETFIKVFQKITDIPQDNFSPDFSQAFFDFDNKTYFVSVVHFYNDSFTKAAYDDFNNPNVVKYLYIGTKEESL